jgi:hypothetical protein
MANFQFNFQSVKQRKVGWVGDDSNVDLAKHSLVKKEVWVGALSWCNHQSFFSKSSERSLRHFHAVALKRCSSMEIFWPARKNSLWTILLRSKKIISMLFNLLFICLAFFSASACVNFPSTAHAFFPLRLSNHFQGLCCTFSRDVHKIWCCFFVGSIAKLHHARYMIPNKKK